jgi:hypothetical protein
MGSPRLCGVIAPHIIGGSDRFAQIDIGFGCKVPFSKLKTKTNPLK